MHTFTSLIYCHTIYVWLDRYNLFIEFGRHSGYIVQFWLILAHFGEKPCRLSVVWATLSDAKECPGIVINTATLDSAETTSEDV